MIRRIATLSTIVLTSAAIISGCGKRETPVMPSAQDLSSYENVFLTRLDKGVDPIEFAAAHGLEAISADPKNGLLLFRSESELAPERLAKMPVVQKCHRSARVGHANTLYGFHQNTLLGFFQNTLLGFFQGGVSEAEMTGQDALACLDLDQAHAEATGAGITVAVIDTGIDDRHPYLAGQVLQVGDPAADPLFQFEHTSNGIDDSGNGLVDEGFGHGTHTAGLIHTVAPDAQIISLRALDDDGLGTDYEIARALETARDLGADIVNLSLAFSAESPIVADALADLRANGIILTAAGGNGVVNALFPATDTNSVGVAALEDCGNIAGFSARGLDVDFAVPGVELLASFPLDENGDARVAAGTGTSAACGVMSGVIAVLLEANGGDDDLALSALQTSGQSVTPAEGALFGSASLAGALGIE